MRLRLSALALLAGADLWGGGSFAGASSARIPLLWRNCTNVNRVYPQGIGRIGARDHTTGTEPVTSFKRNNVLYRRAMSYNRGLDRDHDGIACEKW